MKNNYEIKVNGIMTYSLSENDEISEREIEEFLINEDINVTEYAEKATFAKGPVIEITKNGKKIR